MIQLYIHVDPRHDGWKQMQVHTKRSLTTIPTCGRQGSTTTNTKLTYNLFTPGPSVRLVENLAEDQLPLLLLLQVPEVVLVHHPVGPLLVEVLFCGNGRSSCWCAAPEPFLLPVCRPLTITGKVLPVLCHIACMPHSDYILRRVHVPLLNALELRWKKCFLRPLSVIPAVLWNIGFSVPSWHFHNIFGMLQSLDSLFINCQIVIASPGLRLKRKIEL